MSYKSDVEELYERLQTEIGGTRPWSELTGPEQQMFVDAVRFIMYTCAKR